MKISSKDTVPIYEEMCGLTDTYFPNWIINQNEILETDLL